MTQHRVPRQATTPPCPRVQLTFFGVVHAFHSQSAPSLCTAAGAGATLCVKGLAARSGAAVVRGTVARWLACTQASTWTACGQGRS
jgi:hypothetical protein